MRLRWRLLPSFLQPVTTLANVGQQVQRAAGAFDRMLEVLDEPIAIDEPPDAQALPRAQPRDTYGSRASDSATRPTSKILHDLSLTESAGKHVAIVGPSGSREEHRSSGSPAPPSFGSRRKATHPLWTARGTCAQLGDRLVPRPGSGSSSRTPSCSTRRCARTSRVAQPREGAKTDAEVLEAARAARLEELRIASPPGRSRTPC